VRRLALLFCGFLAVAFAGGCSRESPAPPPESPAPAAPIDRGAMPEFALEDVQSGTTPLFPATGIPPQLVVVALTSTRCPIAALHAPRLAELARRYEERGVRFLLVNPNSSESAQELAAFAKKSGVQFPVLRDPDQQICNALEVHRTTEVFVVDFHRRIRYRGALDDQYSVGARKPRPERHYLVEALEALLAGKAPAAERTQPAGCALTRPAKPQKASSKAPSYHADVAPILRKRCAECHQPGEIGPFSLLTYDDARSVAAMMREVVERQLMPPWHASAEIGSWRNDRSLTEAERATLFAWVDAGAPEGAPAAQPLPAPTAAGTWHLGKPDLLLTTSEQQIPPQGIVDLRYELVDTGLTEDRWLSGAELRAGNRSVVHHIQAFAIYPTDLPTSSDAPRLTAGYSQRQIATLVPGERYEPWPDGTGRFLPAGSKILFQIHYTPNGVGSTDRSTLALRFAPEKPSQILMTRGVHHRPLNIPPLDPAVRVDARWELKKDTIIYGLMPHMHLRGKSFRYDATLPNGMRVPLLDVPRYDFAWQTLYRPEVPIELPAGTEILCQAIFDNSPANPNNPNPNISVHFGEQSTDEMMIGYIDYVER